MATCETFELELSSDTEHAKLVHKLGSLSSEKVGGSLSDGKTERSREHAWAEFCSGKSLRKMSSMKTGDVLTDFLFPA